jgi:hypothetical protein
MGLAKDLGDGSGLSYRQQLLEFGEAFDQIEQRYPGVAAAMFNCEAGYLPSEMLPAAEWISDGGSAEDAVEMARNGDFLEAEIDEALESCARRMRDYLQGEEMETVDVPAYDELEDEDFEDGFDEDYGEDFEEEPEEDFGGMTMTM